jgi:SAM-dependent methyltransferase
MDESAAERFAADWLALREPVDARARSLEVLGAARRWAVGRPRIRVLDLGCGTGSNLRYLCPRLPTVQHWTCLDHDPALIAEFRRRGWDCQQVVGLDAQVASIRATTWLDGVDSDTLVTASALLDLVSASWLEEVVARCLDRGAALLFALTYDGRVEIEPAHPRDREVIAVVNTHQHRDKGLGRALGPGAADRLTAIGDKLGYRLAAGDGDWLLGRDESALAAALLDGWLAAAADQAPGRAAQLASWHSSRRAAAASGELRIRVGHRDLFLDHST